MAGLVPEVNIAMAKEGHKDKMWTDLEKYPDLDGLTEVCIHRVMVSSTHVDTELNIEVNESELMEELKNSEFWISPPPFGTWRRV